MSQYNFYDDDFCLNSCKESNGNPYHKKNDKECISVCNNNNGYYLNKNDNICYQTSDTKCKFLKENSGENICLSACNVGDGLISSEGLPINAIILVQALLKNIIIMEKISA